MAKSNYEIIGSDRLYKKLQELGNGARLAALRGVKSTCMEILADAKVRLTEGGHRVTSALFNSGKVLKSDEDKNAYEARFEADYAPFVEFGRRPGKGLNEEGIKNVAQWAIKKGILSAYSIKTRKKVKAGSKDIEQRARDFAIQVSKRYKRRGRKATPFLFPAFEAKKGNVDKNIGKELGRWIKELEAKV